jgi:hypothetical protein
LSSSAAWRPDSLYGTPPCLNLLLYHFHCRSLPDKELI